MPRGVTDWTQAKIYKMTCPDNFFYIGSTCMPLPKRRSWHKNLAASRPNRKAYAHFNKVGWGLVKIELLEAVQDCTCDVDLKRVEDGYIKDVLGTENCLNLIRAHRTRNQYRIDNKEVIRQKNKTFREENRDVLRTRKKKYHNKNRVAILQRGREKYQENREKLIAKAKDYYEANTDKVKAYKSRYQQDNKEVLAKKARQHYEENKEAINRRKQQYYKDNKEALGIRQAEKIECDCCGSMIRRSNILAHKKTTKCINFTPTEASGTP